MRPKKIENMDELLSSSDKKEHQYIRNIMMSYGIFEDGKAGLLQNLFSHNVAGPSIA